MSTPPPHPSEAPGDWFAAQVWAGRERLSASHLESRGYEVFLPQYRECRRWSDRVRKIDRALFAGYLFCRLHGDAFGSVITAPGVIRIVGNGEQPLPIPAHEIAAIRRVVETRSVVEPWQYLQTGQRVRVDLGPLRGTEGIVVRTQPRDRLVVSISLLQRSVAVEIDSASVTVLSDAECDRTQPPAG